MRLIRLRFEAPLMAFGAPTINAKAPTYPFPTLSMVSGLIANALGYDHLERGRTQGIQNKIEIASVAIREGGRLEDFSCAAVDLADETWTTYGEPIGREGAKTSYSSTTQRFPQYIEDGAFVTFVAVDESQAGPTLGEMAAALARPARPLFIGRKSCVPTARLFAGIVEVDDIAEALVEAATEADRDALGQWPEDWTVPASRTRMVPVSDARDWATRVHGGQRLLTQGYIDLARGIPCS